MSQGFSLHGKNCLSIPTQSLPSLPWGLGLVQDRTFIITPPPQEVLQGVLTVDHGLRVRSGQNMRREITT